MDKKRIACSFSRAASSYDSMAYFQRDVGKDLLAQVSSPDPSAVMDLGSGTGAFSQKLIDQFEPSLFIATDLAHGMNCYARSRHKNYQQNKWVTADAESLPFKNDSFDLIFANLSLQWCEQLDELRSQIFQVLKPGGTLWYSTLLDGSLTELSQSWQAVDQFQHVNHFLSEDKILQAWQHPEFIFESVQRKQYRLLFQSPMQLMRELKGIGAHFMDSMANPAVTSPGTLKKMMQAYQAFRDDNGQFPATYEVLMLGIKKR